MNTKTTLIAASGLALAFLSPAVANAGDKFKEMDSDGDDRVTRAEYSAGALAQLAQLDTNADGVIFSEEISVGAEKKTSKLKFWQKDDQAFAPGMLSSFDQNSDGQVTRSEHQAGVEERFGALDTNNDGALTEDELDAGKHAKDRK